MINLDEKERPILDIQVAGKNFKIKRVVSGVFQRYGDFAKSSGEALKRISDLQTRLDDGKDFEEVQEEYTELQTVSEEVAQLREKMETECIGLILEKNGYELDWDWWLENTDTTDRQGFIVECLNKDYSAGGSGKKKQAL